jgi:hypothetical protein
MKEGALLVSVAGALAASVDTLFILTVAVALLEALHASSTVADVGGQSKAIHVALARGVMDAQTILALVDTDIRAFAIRADVIGWVILRIRAVARAAHARVLETVIVGSACDGAQ